MAHAFQVSVKVFSYCCSISRSIRDKYFAIAALHAETQHTPHPVRQSAAWAFCSMVIFKCLDGGCCSWGFLAAWINGYWKKNCGVRPLLKIFRNEEVACVRKSLAIKHDHQEIVPCSVCRPRTMRTRRYQLNFYVVAECFD